MISREVVDALYAKHATDQWVCIREARAGAGFDGNSGSADFIAINAWPSRGFEVIGYEVKVSRTDWVREQKRPEKAERFWRHCHQWSLVVPAPVDAIVKPGELPQTWGLCEVQSNGKIQQLVVPPRKNPEPLPWSWCVGWMSQLSRLQTRVDDEALHKAYQRGCDESRKAVEKQFATRDGELRDKLRKLGLGAHDWVSDEDAKLFKEIRSQRDANLRLNWSKNGIKQAIESLQELAELVDKMGLNPDTNRQDNETDTN